MTKMKKLNSDFAEAVFSLCGKEYSLLLYSNLYGLSLGLRNPSSRVFYILIRDPFVNDQPYHIVSNGASDHPFLFHFPAQLIGRDSAGMQHNDIRLYVFLDTDVFQGRVQNFPQ